MIRTADFGWVYENRVQWALRNGILVFSHDKPIMNETAYLRYGGYQIFKYLAGEIDKLTIRVNTTESDGNEFRGW